LRERVARPSDLEGADGLEVLELEVDLCRPVEVEAEERRADGGADEQPAGALDLREGDQNETSTPAPASRARA
jgi:hypothetical protein